MNRSIIAVTLRTRRLATFWFSIGLLLFGLLVLGIWPTFKDIDIGEMMDAFSGSEMLSGVKVETESALERTFYQYLSSQHSNWVTLVLAYFGIWFGAGIITRDFGTGTLDVLLAAPISRVRFLTLRSLALIVAAAIVTSASLISLLIGISAWVSEIQIAIADLALMHVQMLLFTLATMGIGLLLAVLFLQSGRTYGIAALLVILMFVVTIVAGIVTRIDWLGYVSLFEYWNPIDQLATSKFVWRDALVLSGVILVTWVASLAIFRRRDIVA